MRAMRRAILVAAMTVALAAPMWAQQAERPPQEAVTCYVPANGDVAPGAKAKRPQPLDPADVETLTGYPYPVEMRPAPKPGHPLDPADVDVLTGKTRRSAYEDYGYQGKVTPYYYYPVDPYGSGYGAYGRGGRFDGDLNSTRVRAPFVPPVPLFRSRLFSRFGGNSLFFR